MCLSLHRLNLQLQSAFRLRDNVASLKSESEALMGADNDLDRVYSLIARHRESCALCKLDMALMDISLHRD
jgi:hypothetical protein